MPKMYKSPGKLHLDYFSLVTEYHANKDLKNLLSDKFDEIE
jgi:hypothetical protein